MKQVRAFLVFPKDKTALLQRNAEVGRIAHAAFENIRDWLAAETGYTFDLRFDVVTSSKTARELGAYVPDSPFPDIPHNDPCGQGLHWGTIISEIDGAAGGFGGKPEQGRHLAIVINGGGWAGGTLTWHPTAAEWLDEYSKGRGVGTDIGRAVVGDWHFTYAATGQVDPCAVREHGQEFAKGDFRRGLGHECLHAFGVECHAPVTYFGDHLNDEQKQQYITRNKAYLELRLPPIADPASPVEPTHPMTPPTGRYRLEGEFTGAVEAL